MRKIFRVLLHWFYRPLLQQYLRKGRLFRYRGLRLFIPAGIFHPAFFGSTKVMAQFIQEQKLEGKSLLEIGCGSGLLSLIAARRGAEVTAVDVNPIAVACCRDNASRNGLSIKALHSDLFKNLPDGAFDVILSNPPYYEGEAQSAAAAAWYCGEDFSFFRHFFAELPRYTHSHSRIWLILSGTCNLENISAIAGQYQHTLNPIYQATRLFEGFILFEARPTTAKNETELAK